MKYYITGDTHQTNDLQKIFDFKENLTEEDYIIIAGDAGFVWSDSSSELYLRQKIFDLIPATILFIDGNHENFNLLYSYPLVNFKGGKAHKINDKMFHLTRGQIFDFNGKKVFTFGGATSIDKNQRVENISWWSQELPTVYEQNNGLDQLDSYDNKVDYIITHALPFSVLTEITNENSFMIDEDTLVMYLDEIKAKVSYDKWFCGHYHIDKNVYKDNIYMLYNRIYVLC